MKGIPNWAALPILAAFLIEYPFYLVAGFAAMRERLGGPALPAFLVVSATLPYLAAAPAIDFRWMALAQLAALALAVGLWYRVLPVSALTDLGFLALVASVYLLKFFDPDLSPGFQNRLSFLGHLTLIHLGVLVDPGAAHSRDRLRFLAQLARLAERRGELPVFPAGGRGTGAGVARGSSGRAAAMAGAGDFLRHVVDGGSIRRVPVSRRFAGVAGGVDLSRWAALALASLAFGAVHLWFRGFPNWRWALLTAALGWFCGRARNQAGDIRAGMVTHALAIATWMGFFAR